MIVSWSGFLSKFFACLLMVDTAQAVFTEDFVNAKDMSYFIKKYAFALCVS